MGILSDGSSDGLYKDFTVPSSFTVCGWFLRVGNGTGANVGIYPCISIALQWDEVNIGVATGDGYWAIGTTYTGYTPHDIVSDATYDWRFAAIARNGTTFTGYVGVPGSALASYEETSVGPATWATVHFNHNIWSDWFSGHMAGLKMWNATLTSAELEIERHSLLPRKFSDLYFFNPEFATGQRTTDFSGGGNSLSDVGGASLSDGLAPPTGYAATESGLYVPIGAKPLYAQLDEAVRDSNDYVYL